MASSRRVHFPRRPTLGVVHVPLDDVFLMATFLHLFSPIPTPQTRAQPARRSRSRPTGPPYAAESSPARANHGPSTNLRKHALRSASTRHTYISPNMKRHANTPPSLERSGAAASRETLQLQLCYARPAVSEAQTHLAGNATGGTCT